MARSKWKFLYVSKSSIRKFFLIKFTKTNIKIFVSRKSYILKNDLSNLVYIHTGRSYVELKVSKLVIGNKFGVFALTRKLFFFPKKEVKNKLERR